MSLRCDLCHVHAPPHQLMRYGVCDDCEAKVRATTSWAAEIDAPRHTDTPESGALLSGIAQGDVIIS